MATARTSEEVSRPFLVLHVFASAGSGKKTFKKKWFDSAHSRVLPEIADMHLQIHKSYSEELFSNIETSDSSNHSFILIYREDSQDSVAFVQKALEVIYTSFKADPISITVIENHFEKTFKPSFEVASQPPRLFDLTCAGTRSLPLFWKVNLLDGVQVSAIFDQTIISPTTHLMGEDTMAKVIVGACRTGRLQVLKLLAPRLEDSNPVAWLPLVMESLETADTTSYLTSDLSTVANYIYNLQPVSTMSTIVRLAEKFPRASLYLLNEFYQPGSFPKHFVRTGFALISLPSSWVANQPFTHIDLSNNLLPSLPVELFQLSTLSVLNVSHNCLETVPSILKWNCGSLRELRLSHNRLKDTPFSLLEGQRLPHEAEGGPPPPGKDRDPHERAAYRLRRLTGYNLYPCIRSLSNVSLSHNRSLTQVPEWVCLLPHITLLELEALPRLTSLTPHLSRCRYLCVLKIDADNLQSPPPEVTQRGTRATMAFLRCKLRGSLPYRHVKLVLMGDRGTGKSTIFNLLLGLRPSTEPNSPHMEVASFDYRPRQRTGSTFSKQKSVTDHPRLTFHVIDFAGSETYHCTHRCFLTYRSIYLVLWNLGDGKDGLRTVLPWLRSIQACVPGSPVILIATHFDLRPNISTDMVLSWEEEVLGDVKQLRSRSYAAKFGLPPIERSVVLDSRNQEDINFLKGDIYHVARRLRHPRSQSPVIEDQVPRSYQELQSLVEVKVKSMTRGGGHGGKMAPVLKHEEFVDYVRSLMLHERAENLEEDEEEFVLACRFLHEAGTIVHFKSNLVGISDLYILDPQWLFNALATIVTSRLHIDPPSAILESKDLPSLLSEAEVPPTVFNSFLSMMESFDILVSLDMEKETYLLPSLLPSSPPPHYPSYNLTVTDDKLTQYIQFDYLPNGFFSRLLARVLIYLRQLSGQLLVSGDSSGGGKKEDEEEGVEEVDGMMSSKLPLSLPNPLSFSRGYKVDRNGYMCLDDMGRPQDEGTIRTRIRALSSALSISPTRHRSLTEKLVSLSQPFLRQKSQTATSTLISLQDPKGSLSRIDPFCSYVFWKNGLFVEFPSGTKFWMESCERAIAIIISGALVSRVKVLTFIMSCTDALVTEVYGGLCMGHYSPCPSCLQQYWKSHDKSADLDSGVTDASVSSVSISYSGKVTYSTSSLDSITSAQSFSGTNLKLVPSPPAVELTGSMSTKSIELTTSALLEGEVTLFPLNISVMKSAQSSSITCGKCGVTVPLHSVSPHVLLVDFSDKFLLDPAQLLFTEDENSLLGSGGFSKVFRGTYKDEEVAVKSFFRGDEGPQGLVQQYKDLRGELTVMSQLNNPQVVTLVGVCLRPLCMVLPFAPLGSLTNHLELCPQGFDPDVAHQLLYQIADGLRYLHSLYIVHRDVKPSNVLVWSLHPELGVDVRLTDYGISQFSSPFGLRRYRGTEEYMAPELFRSRNYDEKVDVYSFALILHLVMTGKKLFSSLMQKRDHIRVLYRSDLPQLSQSLAESLAENLPCPKSRYSHILEDGRHPASRRDLITACHTVCMQQLMEDCLSQNPSDRPTAQGVCSRLLVCPGGQPQANFFIKTPITHALYCSSPDAVLGLRQSSDQVLVLSPTTWQVSQPTIPYQGEQFGCCVCVGKEVFLASAKSNLLFSLGLPSLTSGHISPEPLPGQPLCLIPHATAKSGGLRLVVGMTAGRVAVFYPPGEGQHLLETKPFVTQVLNNPDVDKIAISCGVFHQKIVWCGCGRYLIGLDTKDYILRHYKPVLMEQGAVKLIAAAAGKVWVSFEGRSEVVVCDTRNGMALDSIKCSSLLSTSSAPLEVAEVTALVSSLDAVWVGTRGGHLVAFDPLTAEILLVHKRHSHISSVLPIGGGRLITFGRGEVGEEGEEGEEELSGMFVVWTSFIHQSHCS